MSLRNRIVALCLCVFAVATGAARGEPVQNPPVKAQIGETEVALGGFVTAIGEDSITIRPGESKETAIRFDAAGRVAAEVTTVIPARPPIKIALSKTLMDGEAGMPAPHSYGIKDVKVGDRVVIDLSRKHGVTTCVAICIQRRSGGRVPPAPGERPGNPTPWHERCNAEQDFEEKGIPLPEKFKPGSEKTPEPPGIPFPRTPDSKPTRTPPTGPGSPFPREPVSN
jgi:hypothetical protein